MQKILRERGLPALWPALIGTLLALGLALPILRAMDLSGSMGAAVCACLLTGLFCTGLGIGFRRRWIVPAIAGIILLIALLTGQLARIPALLRALVALFSQGTEPLQRYAGQVGFLMGMAMTLVGWVIARQNAGFYPALSTMMVVLIIVWLLGERENILLFAPSLIALCMLFAHSTGEGTPMLRILIASTLTVVLALCASPLLQATSTRLEDSAEWIRSYITDRFFFSGERRAYSIAQDGFKPLQTRLGGPIQPQDRPVMMVETPRSVLLRGVVYNEYNALNWVNTITRSSFVYDSMSARNVRAETFDENRPAGSLRQSSLFDETEIRITMQSASASTLFVPLRTSALSMPSTMVLYFSRASELYTTRDLQPGDVYSVKASFINPSDPGLSEVLLQASLQETESQDMSHYLRLPAGISNEVYDLAYSLVQTAPTPLDKALAIQNHLRTGYRYTLSPEIPPDNQDFVSFFLLRGKEGYCTYFATAMAVMCRIAGLPTRYVEGYLAEPSGGVALVTSKKAHAWTEVYFDGFGWIAFDATPSESRGGPRRDSSLEPNEPFQDTADQQPDTDEPATTPTPPPSASEDQEGSAEMQSDEEEDVPSGDNPLDQPDDTPPPPADAQDPDPGDPPPADAQRSPQRWWIWLLVLLCIAAIALVVYRALTMRPLTIAARCSEDGDKLRVWYRALLGLLAAAGMPAKPYETPSQYALRVERGIPKEAGFLQVADSVTMLEYGRYVIGPAEVSLAADCYRSVWRVLPLPARIKWVVLRTLRGLGSIRQIP